MLSTYRRLTPRMRFAALAVSSAVGVGAAAAWGIFGNDIVAPRVLGAAAQKPTTTTTAPSLAAPVITSRPEDPTFETAATFAFVSASNGVTYQCALDKDALSACASGVTFTGLKEIDHTFQVRAVASGGRTSPITSYAWTIVKKLGFEISGDADALIRPGALVPLNLRFVNPYNFAIQVDKVSITVDDVTSNSLCSGTANLVVAQPFAGPVPVAANATVTLSGSTFASSRPVVMMPDLPVNQDACKDTAFHLNYVGTASKP
jgi:hypothetical protein